MEKDSQGYRGANLNTQLDEMRHNLEKKLLPYFKIVQLQNATWKTCYTREGLWLLLNNTISTVRDFDPIKDKTVFDEAIKQLQVDNHITLTQNRLIIVASKE